MSNDLSSRLREVQDSDSPAHSARAGELLAALSAAPDDSSTLEAARLLIDAYLHDPHLMR
jgi:hypothetical protein